MKNYQTIYWRDFKNKINILWGPVEVNLNIKTFLGNQMKSKKRLKDNLNHSLSTQEKSKYKSSHVGGCINIKGLKWQWKWQNLKPE